MNDEKMKCPKCGGPLGAEAHPPPSGETRGQCPEHGIVIVAPAPPPIVYRKTHPTRGGGSLVEWIAYDITKAWDGLSTVGAWLLDVPGAHPVWRWRILSLIHLRPSEWLPDPLLLKPDSTHEFGLIAVNPKVADPIARLGHGHPALRQDLPPWHLVPEDMSAQVQKLTDVQAHRLGDRLVQAAIDGVLIPDRDAATHWETAIRDTAEHYAAGDHPEIEN